MTTINLKFNTFTHMKNSLNTFANKLSKHLIKTEPKLKDCNSFSNIPNFKYNISPTLTTESIILINNMPVIVSPFGGLEIKNQESCKNLYNSIDMQSVLKGFIGIKPTTNINFFSANSPKYNEYLTCTTGKLEVKNLDDVTKITTQWNLFASNQKNKLAEMNFEYDFELKCVKLTELSNNIADSQPTIVEPTNQEANLASQQQTLKTEPQAEPKAPNNEMVTPSEKPDLAPSTPNTDSLAKAAQSTAAIKQSSHHDPVESYKMYFCAFVASVMLVAEEVYGNPLKWLAGENAGHEHFE